MPTVTISFNLPEDASDHELCMKASNLYNSIKDLDNKLREVVKYDNTAVIKDLLEEDISDDDIQRVVAAVRKLLHNIREENNSYLEEEL